MACRCDSPASAPTASKGRGSSSPAISSKSCSAQTFLFLVAGPVYQLPRHCRCGFALSAVSHARRTSSVLVFVCTPLRVGGGGRVFGLVGGKRCGWGGGSGCLGEEKRRPLGGRFWEDGVHFTGGVGGGQFFDATIEFEPAPAALAVPPAPIA